MSQFITVIIWIKNPSQTSDMIDIRRDSYWWLRRLIWMNSNGNITILHHTASPSPSSIWMNFLPNMFWRSSPSSGWRRSWLLARGWTWLCSSSTTRTRRERCSRLAVRLPPSPSSSSACTHRHRRRHLIITTITISFIVKIITLATIDPDSKSLYKLEQRDFTGVVDLTWGGWRKMQNLSE